MQDRQIRRRRIYQAIIFLSGLICGVIVGLSISKCPYVLPPKEGKIETTSEGGEVEFSKEEKKVEGTKVYVYGGRVTPQVIFVEKATGGTQEQITHQTELSCDSFPFSISLVDPPPVLLNRKIIDMLFTSGITLSCGIVSEEYSMEFPCELQSPRLTLFFSLDGAKLFKIVYKQNDCSRDLFSYNFIVDTQPPETRIILKDGISPETEVLTVSDAEFEIITSEPVAYTLCKVDDGLWFDCSLHRLYLTNIEEGWHELWAFSVDIAGNEEIEKKVFRFKVDARPPTTILISAPTSVTSSTSATFKFKADEENVRFECNIDDAGWIPCSSPFEISELKPGYHTFRIRAIDSFGRIEPEPLSYSWQIIKDNKQNIK